LLYIIINYLFTISKFISTTLLGLNSPNLCPLRNLEYFLVTHSTTGEISKIPFVSSQNKNVASFISYDTILELNKYTALSITNYGVSILPFGVFNIALII